MARSLSFLDTVLIITWEQLDILDLRVYKLTRKIVPKDAYFGGMQQATEMRDSYRGKNTEKLYIVH